MSSSLETTSKQRSSPRSFSDFFPGEERRWKQVYVKCSAKMLSLEPRKGEIVVKTKRNTRFFKESQSQPPSSREIRGKAKVGSRFLILLERKNHLAFARARGCVRQALDFKSVTERCVPIKIAGASFKQVESKRLEGPQRDKNCVHYHQCQGRREIPPCRPFPFQHPEVWSVNGNRPAPANDAEMLPLVPRAQGR